uniref:UPAR/Ly6 domain-containing protein n=1 Tax=Oryzias latipes TaxID=8090 RepID=A0A3P9I0D5_ORYLA
MILFKLLILFLTLSAGKFLYFLVAKIYQMFTCFHIIKSYDIVTKGCQTSALCVGAVKCCEGDLCNSSAPPGSSSLLIMLTAAMFILFL